MKLTALHIARLRNEIVDIIVPAKLVKLHKSEDLKIISMHLKTDIDNYSLVFHFGPNSNYLFLDKGFTTKIKTTNFLPQLINSRITNIEQFGFDRIICFDLEVIEEKYRIIFELFGHNNNLLLLNENDRIITTIRKSKTKRDKYEPPQAMDLVNPTDFDHEEVIGLISDQKNKLILNTVMDTFLGLDKTMVMNLLAETEIEMNSLTGDIDKAHLEWFFDKLKQNCLEFINPATTIYYSLDQQTIHLNGNDNLKSSKSISDILKEFSLSKISIPQTKSPVQMLKTKVKKSFKKERRKLEKLTDQLSKAREHGQFKKQAELLSIYIEKLTKGMTSIEVNDIYSDSNELIEITLNPVFTPSGNIRNLFTKARKLKEKIPGIENEIELTNIKIDKLNELDKAIQKITGNEIPEEIQSMVEKLELDYGVKSNIPFVREEKPRRLPYRHYITNLGEDIYVGRTARDNDVLTFKFARKDDLWFHAQQASGSHVILRKPNRAHQFQKQSIIETAQIAAYFSSAKNSAEVAVIYTETKFVRKARKGKPGLVIAERTKSLMVEPKAP